MARRVMTKWFAVTALTAVGGVGHADPKPELVAAAPQARVPERAPPAADVAADVVLPRVLRTGAPACGNVMFKSYQPRDPVCTVLANLHDLEDLGRSYADALTLEARVRPSR